MSRDILSEYGSDSHQPQKPPAAEGGVCHTVDVHNYQTPKGPSNIGNPKAPGLHGTNHGTCGTQGRY